MSKHDTLEVQDDTKQNRLGLVVLLIVGFYIFKLFGWSILPSDEIKAYPVSCKTELIQGLTGYCPNSDFGNTYNIDVYQVNPQRQEVIKASDYSQDRYTKCAIVDRNNWNCQYDDESGSFGFNKGSAFSSAPFYFFVSRVEYIKISAEEHGGMGAFAVWLIMPLFL